MSVCRERLTVRGRVQGVGFRPFVWREATRLGLAGAVANTADGVAIDVQGDAAALTLLRDALEKRLPPLARVDALEAHSLPASEGASGFVIADSGAGVEHARAPADSAICEACLTELFDSANRRYRHALINCTDCGPRYTVIGRLPYDRAHTSMAPFALCPACAAEYADPASRRFHAEPTCCPACGPQLTLTDAAGRDLGEPVAGAVRLIAEGQIVALKSLGGYHLACDARNAEAVARLRARKQRPHKPFALLLPNLASARRLARVNDAEAALLASRERPIVLLARLPHTDEALSLVAPGCPQLGVMLPATPLQWLLLSAAEPDCRQAAVDLAWVMTSANLSGEPVLTDESDARDKLAGVADAFLAYDREIVARCDDSVLRVTPLGTQSLRRARGYAPEPLTLARAGAPVLATGSYLKNTVTVLRGRDAFVSPHIGELNTRAGVIAQQHAAEHLLALTGVQPALIACEAHAEHAATNLARELAGRLGAALIEVQHHHAHAAAVLAEHGHSAPALALTLDGFGAGPMGDAWGGELLRLNGATCRRLGHLATLPLPGVDRAARESWRMATALRVRLGLPTADARFAAAGFDTAAIEQMVRLGLRSPETSSLGRWFDAIAALAGVNFTQSFEGQAAQALEALARPCPPGDGLWRLDNGVLSLWPLAAHLATLGDAADIASCWHATLAAALADWAITAAQDQNVGTVALAGGCLANARLMQPLTAALRAAGLEVLLPVQLPAGDGAISLGQAWVARLSLESP
ncbi:carbamoyltransferase HypF [Crenobacter caeni]|uniref:Carbamoyltransferase HypF n=1 Tax=Crenobacter caeni TaxID=2705474 RepID=A0A6B2KVI6_9NEIS|nr:carbamoyltransferase HypF [Crenobacter caeni]NDV13977.1 carbamoyltransferase HypF [Crenobacter caeni]